MSTERAAPSALIAQARKDWKKASEAEDPQRKSILAAKQFRAGNQWDPALKLARAGSQALQGVPAQPPRPCLVVDRLSQPVRQTSNTIKNASFGFDVLPNGAGADDETAEIYKGYMRRVHNNARGESPIEWAADGAIEGGLGWFRLRTEYVHENWDGDPNDPAVFDQEIREERITNNLSVYCDPSSLHPTRRDARFMFVTEDIDKEDEKYGTMDLRGLDEFMATGDMQGWVSTDTIRVAEYWRVEFTKRWFYQLVPDGPIFEGKAPKGEKPHQTREMRVPTIKCDIINAVESLKSYEWVGTRIPLFPILGEELNVDGKPVLRGIIQEGMDAQRMVNYSYSAAMEIFALSVKKAPMIPWEGVANFKQIWDTRTTVNWSYLPYQEWDENGRQISKPTLDTTESPIQAAVELMRVSEEAIKATTSTGDASLGNSHPNERSGRALQALQAASDLANSNYPDNVRRALIAAAEEMAIVIPKITRKGQIIQILGLDEEPKQVMVGQPFQEGTNGVPVASPPEITPEMAKLEGSLHKFYDLNNGRYAVTVTVGKANATKREEGAAAIGELIPHLPPEMAAVATPEYVQQLSFPGAQKMAEKLRLTLPPHLQDQDNKDGIPPQVAAMVAQLQQQVQQLTQALQTDQAKQQATIQSAQISAQADTQTSQVDAQKDIQLQQMKLQAEMQMAETKLRLEAESQMQVEQLKADLAIQLEQMKEEASYRVAEMQAQTKAASVRKVSASQDENGNESYEITG